MLVPNLCCNVFLEVPALLDVRHCPKLQSCIISRKDNDATLRKWQRTKFGPDFGPFDPNSFPKNIFVFFTSTNVRHCRKLSSYSILRKTYDLDSRN